MKCSDVSIPHLSCTPPFAMTLSGPPIVGLASCPRDFSLYPVTCFYQWDFSKRDKSRSLKKHLHLSLTPFCSSAFSTRTCPGQPARGWAMWGKAKVTSCPSCVHPGSTNLQPTGRHVGEPSHNQKNRLAEPSLSH